MMPVPASLLFLYLLLKTQPLRGKNGEREGGREGSEFLSGAPFAGARQSLVLPSRRFPISVARPLLFPGVDDDESAPGGKEVSPGGSGGGRHASPHESLGIPSPRHERDAAAGGDRRERAYSWKNPFEWTGGRTDGRAGSAFCGGNHSDSGGSSHAASSGGLYFIHANFASAGARNAAASAAVANVDLIVSLLPAMEETEAASPA
jgi:hypothetical protein